MFNLDPHCAIPSSIPTDMIIHEIGYEGNNDFNDLYIETLQK